MKALIYRYGSICEPDIISSFQKIGLEVIEETTELNHKSITPSECVEMINNSINTHHPLFVFSINFYPAIAEICHLHNTLYLCWTVDSPVLELFSPAIKHNTNRIFLFDRAQYEKFHPYNPSCIFYLPLASNIERFDQTISTITTQDINKYSCDISFVGSLYTEKNPVNTLQNLPEYTKGFIDGLTYSALKIYGYNFIEDILTETIVDSIKSCSNHFYSLPNPIMPMDKYIVANTFLGNHVAEKERIQTLNTLAQHFKVDLFTRSDVSSLSNVSTHDGISTLNVMPKVFHLSKINLNMTIKPIQTGLPLRIFDIMGCGGFLMTNYQSELIDFFEIGTDLEAYDSLDELIDKCDYYLTHESERKKIADNGYLKIKQYHTYPSRILEMFRLVTSN